MKWLRVKAWGCEIPKGPWEPIQNLIISPYGTWFDVEISDFQHLQHLIQMTEIVLTRDGYKFWTITVDV